LGLASPAWGDNRAHPSKQGTIWGNCDPVKYVLLAAGMCNPDGILTYTHHLLLLPY
jgi:hypothetical protein